MGRVVAIGDIHGQLGHLEDILKQLEPDDKLIFIGDYIDRGPNSPEVIERLLGLDQETVFLRGNHEQMALDATDYPESMRIVDLWLFNGGINTHNAYERHPPSLWDKHLEFFRATKLAHKEEIDGITFYFSHAGWSEYANLEEQYDSLDQEILLWTRSHLSNTESAMLNWTDGVAVFGHTPLEKPLVHPPLLGIDTGVAYQRVLTAAILGQEINIIQSEV